MTNYNDGNWHGWNGGECPVHPETLVEAYGGENTKGRVKCRAKFRSWRQVDAFRVIKEHREPREWWVARNNFHAEGFAVVSSDYPGAIHVREVLE